MAIGVEIGIEQPSILSQGQYLRLHQSAAQHLSRLMSWAEIIRRCGGCLTWFEAVSHHRWALRVCQMAWSDHGLLAVSSAKLQYKVSARDSPSKHERHRQSRALHCMIALYSACYM